MHRHYYVNIFRRRVISRSSRFCRISWEALARRNDWTTGRGTSCLLLHFYVHCSSCGFLTPPPIQLRQHSSSSQSTPPSKTACIKRAWLTFRYFALIRRLIETYTLEPAGSHGVWGLDDTSFLPFLLGSGQLRDQPWAPPTASITQTTTVEAQRDKNLYFNAIAWINKVSLNGRATRADRS